MRGKGGMVNIGGTVGGCGGTPPPAPSLLSLRLDSFGVRRGDIRPRLLGGVVEVAVGVAWAIGEDVAGFDASEVIAIAADGPRRP